MSVNVGPWTSAVDQDSSSPIAALALKAAIVHDRFPTR